MSPRVFMLKLCDIVHAVTIRHPHRTSFYPIAQRDLLSRVLFFALHGCCALPTIGGAAAADLMIANPFGRRAQEVLTADANSGERILLPKSLGGTYSSWGDVKEVGLRTTRVRSTDGVMLTIPNKLLTKDAVANFSHRSDMELRVRIRLGVTPTWANVSKAEEIANDIAANHPDICNDPKPPEVVLRDFGDQDVIMEIRYYVDNAKKMRPSKSFFVTEILRRFEESKVSLAFPVMVNMNSDVSLEDLGF